ncbi:MAG: ATP-binding protein [Candidatus Bathyarchaeia archaeon]|nr:ATP-binding protein [Candidatus Bathyarchaeota archaeon]
MVEENVSNNDTKASAGLKLIGYALSGCTHDLLQFVVIEEEHVKVNNFYFIEHPLRPEIYVLTRVFRAQPYNPEMVTGRIGPLAGKKGFRADYGKRLEYIVALAEILGYYDERGKWRSLEVAPSPWSCVYEPSEKTLERFLTFRGSSNDSLLLAIGKIRGTNIPAYIDLNAISRGHMLVAGMTRSGKSSFIINLVAKACNLKPKPRFIIFDRRGEYAGLVKYGARVVPYNKFTPPLNEPRLIAEKIGLKGKERDILIEAVRALISDGLELSKKSLIAKVRDIIEQGSIVKTPESRSKYLNSIKWFIENRGDFLDKQSEPLNIIEELLKNYALIIDFSVDADIEAQHRTASYILNQVREHAMRRKDYGDFACIVIVEEAQYFAPEKGVEIKESNAQSEVKATMIETISQAGGYNVGLLIVTQRPAYVLKSCISQCNTVACFRLRSGNDQNAILEYTEYGSERLKDYLPGLADHEAILWGLAVPMPFPIVVEIDVEEYPRKAATFAKTAWERMEESSMEKAEHNLPLHLREF